MMTMTDARHVWRAYQRVHRFVSGAGPDVHHHQVLPQRKSLCMYLATRLPCSWSWVEILISDAGSILTTLRTAYFAILCQMQLFLLLIRAWLITIVYNSDLMDCTLLKSATTQLLHTLGISTLLRWLCSLQMKLKEVKELSSKSLYFLLSWLTNVFAAYAFCCCLKSPC